MGGKRELLQSRCVVYSILRMLSVSSRPELIGTQERFHPSGPRRSHPPIPEEKSGRLHGPPHEGSAQPRKDLRTPRFQALVAVEPRLERNHRTDALDDATGYWHWSDLHPEARVASNGGLFIMDP